jgi:hypothetical protein
MLYLASNFRFFQSSGLRTRFMILLFAIFFSHSGEAGLSSHFSRIFYCFLANVEPAAHECVPWIARRQVTWAKHAFVASSDFEEKKQ